MVHLCTPRKLSDLNLNGHQGCLKLESFKMLFSFVEIHRPASVITIFYHYIIFNNYMLKS